MDWNLFGFQGLTEVENLHPLFVHFPIALLPSALLLYFLGGVWRRHSLLVAGRYCLILGFLSAIPTVITGLRAQAIPHNEPIHRMMEVHKMIGLSILGLVFILSVWTFWRKGDFPKAFWFFWTILGLANYLAMQNGDIGSRMVYVEGAAVKPALPMMAHEEDRHGHIHDSLGVPHEHR